MRIHVLTHAGGLVNRFLFARYKVFSVKVFNIDIEADESLGLIVVKENIENHRPSAIIISPYQAKLVCHAIQNAADKLLKVSNA